MTRIYFPPQQSDSQFYDDIITEGYHICSLKSAKLPNYYPDQFLGGQGISIKDLKVGDTITVRVFFRVDDCEDIIADGSYMDLEVEEIFHDNITAVILTGLPAELPLDIGDSIEVYEEEILYRNKVTDH